MPSADHRGRVGMSRYPQQPRCYGSLDNALNNKIVARFKLILMLALLLSSITTLLLDAIVDQHYLICWLFFMPPPSFPTIRPSPVDSQDQGLFLSPCSNLLVRNSLIRTVTGTAAIVIVSSMAELELRVGVGDLCRVSIPLRSRIRFYLF